MGFKIYEPQRWKLRKVVEPQRWRLSRKVAARLAMSKNLAMLHWRMKNNLSQNQAADECGVPSYVWVGLENHRLIPTMDEAEKIENRLGLPKHFLFPQIRVRLPKAFIRTTAKLTFIRASRGLTIKELAKMANVPPAFITELERGFEANTNFMDYVLKICDALNSMKGWIKVEEQDIVGDVPDHFYINHESLREAIEAEVKEME